MLLYIPFYLFPSEVMARSEFAAVAGSGDRKYSGRLAAKF